MSLSISDSELEVLKALWHGGPTTVRDLHARLGAEGQTWAYTTVQTLLFRLQNKGFVDSDKTGRAHVFRATRSREELLGDQLDDLAERVCEGTATPLMLALVQRHRFSREEIEGFREMIDRLESEGPPPKKKRKKRSTKGT